MLLQYTTVEISAKVQMPCGDKFVEHQQQWDTEDLPSIPVLTNPTKIPKHTRLITQVDSEVKKLFDKQSEQAMKDKVKHEQMIKQEHESNESGPSLSSGKRKVKVEGDATAAKKKKSERSMHIREV